MPSPDQMPLFSTEESPDTIQPLSKSVCSIQHIQQISVEHTPGHLHCQACMEARSVFAVPLSASMSFSQAAESFLESCKTLASKYSCFALAVIVCGHHATA
jgi:hypothetical protein